MQSRVTRRLGSIFRTLRKRGPRYVASRVLIRIARKLADITPPMLVPLGDAEAVDWSEPRPWSATPIVTTGSASIAWIMSPPGDTSGGHQNLFRFIDFAERAGHKCTIYLYSTNEALLNVASVETMLAATNAYPKLSAEIRLYDGSVGVAADTDAVFATGWETAYPAYLDSSLARRFYFVQDFEAGFYPLGTESLLAENTYRFGFHGITAGGWLADKLSRTYGMPTDSFDFAVDKTHYSVTNVERRSEVFFYARPVTARRAFEFGVLALKEFAKLRPEVTINLAGGEVSPLSVPFPHVNLAALDISQLNDVYNRCAAGLVMSLSNMSLLPLELMSSGVAPVVNDGPNNRMVSDNPFIEYVPASPRAIARRIVEVLDRPDAAERVTAMSGSVREVNWSDSGNQFVAAFERAMRG
jgi:hypothetical protein